MFNSKNSRFIKEQEASGLLSKLETKTPFSIIQIIGKSDKLLLDGYKLMREMHLRKPVELGKLGFTFDTFGPFTKNKEIMQIFKETKR